MPAQTGNQTKPKRTYLIMPLIVVFALICVVAIVCVGAPFGRPSEKQNLSQIPTIEQTDEEILASETTVEHVCRNYYVSKYDKTNHWNECSICGKKYNVVAHTYTETWTMGESCASANKCNHICSCGYSYQTNNTREHKFGNLKAEEGSYKHYQQCSVCMAMQNVGNCTKEDGNRINCNNLGTCTVCKHVYSQAEHKGNISGNGDVKCGTCNKYIGTVSNLVTNYTSSNIFEFSYDISVSNTGNFNGSRLSVSNQNADSDGAIVVSHVKTDKTSTSVNVTGKVEIGSKETKYYFNSYLNNYYVSSDDFVRQLRVGFSNLISDRIPPVINPNIVQTNLATSNGWATQKQITVSGTENFCSSVKLTLKDSEGNTYLKDAATPVTNNAWSYTFVPDIEASETGKEFTITVTDNLGNSANKTFTVQKTDKKAPTMTSAVETSKTWTKTKSFTFTATDEGSGGVSISIGDANNYTVATKSGTTYSRAHTFTEEIYGNKVIKIYFKDGLGNTVTKDFTVYNIDTTKPTITGKTIVNNEIVLTGNDRNTTLNKEGSGIAKYRYLGSSEENVTIGETTGKETTSNKIALTEFAKVKYAYIAAVDNAGNISNTEKVVLPTYKITVNPNGGTWRGVKTNTELPGYNNGQEITIENPTRVGYNFVNWTKSSGTITGTTYKFATSNATLTANWEARTDLSYTVKYLEKGTNNEIKEQKTVNNQTFGSEITASSEVINNIYGYNYDSVNTEKLRISTEENTIIIYYTKKGASVVVHHYIYDNGNTTNKLVDDTQITGKVGETYTTSKSNSVPANYRCKNEEPEKHTGNMTENLIEVNYYYELITPTIENNISVGAGLVSARK